MQLVLVLHNLLRWAIVIFGIWSLINALTGVFGKRIYTAGDNRSNLLFMIFCDIQLLLGLVLYFVNGWYGQLKNMHDPYSRFFSMEHLTMMLIAWVLVHIGRAKVKKATTDAAKHKTALLCFGAAIFLILIAIPWPFREIVGRPWFRF